MTTTVIKDANKTEITEGSRVAGTNRTYDFLLIGEVVRMGKKQATVKLENTGTETRIAFKNCVVLSAA